MKKNWGLWLVLLLSFWAIKPLLSPGWMPVHDNTQVVRVQQMAQALSEGQLPVRWVKDLGYGFGYPLFNFYAPLAYYVGALFNLLGFEVLLATKLMMILGILLSGISMYLLGREFWGERGGIISGLFYLYVPYHAVDIYVRGAVGEFWAMVFIPLVFLALYKVFDLNRLKNGYKRMKWITVASLSFAALILSHNLTALMAIPFIFMTALILLVFAENKRRFIVQVFSLVFLGLSLAAFYWLPALAEMGLTKVLGQIGGGADWRDHFVFLDQLWASPWGFGGSAPGREDGMSFMIGKLHLLLVASSLPILFWSWKKRRKRVFWSLLTGWLFFLLAIFFTQRLSWPVWQLISPLAFVQYPWRFLVFTTFAASFMAGSIGLWFKKIQDDPGLGMIPGLSWVGGIVVILALLFFNTKYFQPQTRLDVSAADYINEENIKWKTSKISDEYLPTDFPVPRNKGEVAWEKVVVTQGAAKVKNLVVESAEINFAVEAEGESEVLVNLAFFPGWQVRINGQKREFDLEGGRIRLLLSSGESQVHFSFKNTLVRNLANLLSLLSFFGWAGFVLKSFHGRA